MVDHGIRRLGWEKPAANRIRVLVVANDLFIRTGIRSMLAGSQLTIINEVAAPHDAIHSALERRPQVMISALLPPELSADLVTRVLAVCPGLRILVLGTGASIHLTDAVAKGAAGLFVTPPKPRDLISAVRIVSAGYTIMPVEYGTKNPCPDPLATVPKLSPLHTLTRRELEVFILVAGGANNQAIAKSLCVSLPTVKSHVHRVLTKLDLRNRVQVVAYARRAFGKVVSCGLGAGPGTVEPDDHDQITTACWG